MDDTTSPPRKRRRHTRKTTGCRQCRRLHVACVEGAVLSGGDKAVCKRCWQTDSECWYPVMSGVMKRRAVREEEWVRGVEVEVWLAPVEDSGAMEAPARISTSTTSGPSLPTIPSTNLPCPKPDASPSVMFTPTTLVDTPWEADVIELPSLPSTEWPLDFLTNSTSTLVPATPAPLLHSSVLRSLLAPDPPKLLMTFTLASHSLAPADRSVVSYFEAQGCNDVVAVNSFKANWMHREVFPRLQSLFSSSASGVGGMMREYIRLNFLHLAHTHRANIETDTVRHWAWKNEAARYLDRANSTLLRAQCASRNDEWKTEEYLIGYFIKCSGSILSNTWAAVDTTSAFELPGSSSALTSPFYHSLREIFTIYSIIQFACTRNGGAPRPPAERPRPAFDLDLTGPEWTEPWFGVSRRTFVLLADVSGIVYQRQAILRAGMEGSALDLILRAEAERLAAELGDVSVWSEAAIEPGLSDRVQRGSALMRHALRTMLLCEVLETDLADPRLAAARARAMELAADCEPSNMVGLQWALTIIAVYTRDVAERDRLRALNKMCLTMSFGPNYPSTDDILDLCWEVLDRDGYPHGIAPWREAMNALGRNLFM
ncbi:uncharacterized protein LOC62_07G009490 [Vanrija pseudolonga]|uniref:Zn(2)-C6 fungal-type domain-containing protein n=1 Tax=Vanrija pseudolonga TaxID=143232 RepID=A0AAF0YGJ9_9TREE|nr:hypothetical protein LOC62_07G009490 [Vanrija pseudolonga]